MRRRFSTPIRWRLALTSAALTLVILLAFALVTSAFTTSRLTSDFDSQLKADAADIAGRIPTKKVPVNEFGVVPDATVAIAIDYAASGGGVVRVLNGGGEVEIKSAGSRALGLPKTVDGLDELGMTGILVDVGEFRVITRPILAGPRGDRLAGYVQVGKSLGGLNATLARVNTFLGLGVLLGTGLALLAGLAVARRAMKPIADLTYAAQHVARTRDPAVRVPRTRAKDEVADLSRTLEDMLGQLDAAQTDIETTLDREREFVADASHELRTPLTSVLANLELLRDSLTGESAEIAESALRSTQRMRRLVADLLFLARADTGHTVPRVPVDLGQVVSDAVAETAPLTSGHEVRVEAPGGVWVLGVADDLHRLVVNLIQNAISHTPPGTIVRIRLRRKAGTTRPSSNGHEDHPDAVIVEISDNGPGVSPETRDRIFERFVRAPSAPHATGAAATGSGLGLAIVGAVASAHDGTVKLTESPDGGARFVVRLPTTGERPTEPTSEPSAGEPAVAQTSTTTGSTRGRRFRRP